MTTALNFKRKSTASDTVAHAVQTGLKQFSREGRDGVAVDVALPQTPEGELIPKGRPSTIVVQQVAMTYRSGGQATQVLHNIDLTVTEGDIHLLMGPSGSGKTTLLSIMGGILQPTSGRVHLQDTDITRLNRKDLATFRRQNIGFIFQGFNLFGAMTAAENIEIILKMKGWKRRAAKLEAQTLLEEVGLGDKQNNLPRDLSGGQKQRVAIARALAGDPPLIMADEPTSALDSHSGQAVIELLRKLAKERGRTVLMVTHDPRLQSVADQVVYLEDGRLMPSTASFQPQILDVA
ncbi:MAG: ABC transporter ATP-binding protein [Elainellaceae cyanobacterium]